MIKTKTYENFSFKLIEESSVLNVNLTIKIMVKHILRKTNS